MFTNYIPNESTGWIKLYKKIFENPVVTKDPETFMIWVYLLALASHPECKTLFLGRQTVVPEGSIVTTSSQISSALGIELTKVKRTLTLLKNALQIKVTPSSQKSLIEIVNWNTYQAKCDPSSAPRVNRACPDGAPSAIRDRSGHTDKNDTDVKDTLEIQEKRIYDTAPYSSSRARAEDGEGEREGCVIPSEDEVARYAKAIGSTVDPHGFWSYYELNEWTCGGRPVKDWRALFRQWKPREAPSGSFDTDEFFNAAVSRSLSDSF